MNADQFTALVDAVGQRWDAPTPCSEWSVRQLVNHVVGEDLWTAPLLRGATIEEFGGRFDGDLLGEAPLRSAEAAAGEAVTLLCSSSCTDEACCHRSILRALLAERGAALE